MDRDDTRYPPRRSRWWLWALGTVVVLVAIALWLSSQPSPWEVQVDTSETAP